MGKIWENLRKSSFSVIKFYYPCKISCYQKSSLERGKMLSSSYGHNPCTRVPIWIWRGDFLLCLQYLYLCTFST